MYENAILPFPFFRGDKIRDQVLNPKRLMLLFVTVLLTYGVESISYGAVCEAGDILSPGESCTYPGTDAEFSVLNNGSGQFLFFTSGNNITIRNTVINGVSYTLVANKLDSGSWEIEEIADSAATPGTTNTAPTFTDGASTARSIAENTAAGRNIGAAIAATDADNDTLTYTLSGTDAASFGIDATTGQLKTKSALDYETKTTYTVTITVSDGSLTDTIAVTINVTDVAENKAPVFTEGASTTRTVELPPKPENPGDMDIGAPLFATDADGDTLRYTLGGADAALFHTYAFVTYLHYTKPGVQLTTRGGSLYDGTKSSYTVVVTVSDGNLTDTITVTINVTDVATTSANRAPVFSQGTSTTRSIAENTTANTNIGTAITATDADNDTLTYTLGGTAAASFGINSSTGQLQTKAALDYETRRSYTVTVIVSDGTLTDTITVTINVTDIDESPTNTAQDYIQGPWLWMIASGADIDADYLAVESGGSITEVQVAQNGVNEGDYLGDLQWTRGQIYPSIHLSFWGIRYSNNVNHVVNAIGLSTDHNLNHYSAYALINIISTHDQNDIQMGVGSDDAVKVWLNGTVVHRNNVDRRTAGIQDRFRVNLKAGNNLLLVKVSDNWNNWGMFFKIYLDEADFTTAIPKAKTDDQFPDTPQPPAPTNSAPIFTNGANTTRSIAENTAAGIHIGSPVAATDKNNDMLTYTLSGTDAASFGIDATTGQLKTKVALDYETRRSYTVTVTVSDGSLTDTITITINVTDVNESLTDAGVCKVGDILAPGESCTYPGTDATFSVLHNGHAKWNIPGLPSWLAWANKVSIGGSLSFSATINDDYYHFIAEEAPNDSWEIKEIEDDGAEQPETPDPPQQPGSGGTTPTLTISTTVPLTETTLDESVVTLTLSGGTYVDSSFSVARAITTSGIDGVTFRSYDVNRVSDTVVTVELTFDGNFQTDSRLIFTVEEGAIAGYSGSTLTAEIPVTAGLEADANNDGVVNTQDLVLVASNYTQTGTNRADINGDGVVNIDDLTTVAGALDSAGSAPSAHPQILEMFTAANLKLWLSHARQRNLTDPTSLKGIRFLEQLLAALLPKETVLLPNYPNPFNPETWIPYDLAKEADVTLTIYDMNGRVVRQFGLGHQAAGRYQSRSRAVYWDGRNEFSEQVGSGVYFYHLSAEGYSATRKMLIIK